MDTLCNSLPHLPQNLPFVILERRSDQGNPIKVTIRPYEVARALAILKEINPAYKTVTISEENLEFYRKHNGVVTGLTVLHQVTFSMAIIQIHSSHDTYFQS